MKIIIGFIVLLILAFLVLLSNGSIELCGGSSRCKPQWSIDSQSFVKNFYEKIDLPKEFTGFCANENVANFILKNKQKLEVQCFDNIEGFILLLKSKDFTYCFDEKREVSTFKNSEYNFSEYAESCIVK